jgi:hypothetical protein
VTPGASVTGGAGSSALGFEQAVSIDSDSAKAAANIITFSHTLAFITIPFFAQRACTAVRMQASSYNIYTQNYRI